MMREVCKHEYDLKMNAESSGMLEAHCRICKHVEFNNVELNGSDAQESLNHFERFVTNLEQT